MEHIKAMVWGALFGGVIWGLVFLVFLIGVPAMIIFGALSLAGLAYSIGRMILLILEGWGAS